MRDSIEHKVISDKEAEIGSNSDIAVIQELGTSTIPARSFLAGAAAHEAENVAKEMARPGEGDGGRQSVRRSLGRRAAAAQPLIGQDAIVV